MRIIMTIIAFIMTLTPISAKSISINEPSPLEHTLKSGETFEFKTQPEVVGERGTGFVLTGNVVIEAPDMEHNYSVTEVDSDTEIHASEVDFDGDTFIRKYNIIMREGIVGSDGGRRTQDVFQITNNDFVDLPVKISYEYELLEDEALSEALAPTLQPKVDYAAVASGALIAYIAVHILRKRVK